MTALRQAVALLLLALLPAAVIGWIQIEPQDGKPGAHPGPIAEGEVTLAAAQTWELVLWVDARTRPQFDRAHIPGAVPLSEERWDQDLIALFDRWKPDSRVVVYCDSATCDKSRQIAERLRREVGLENVHTLQGGWDAWRKGARR